MNVTDYPTLHVETQITVNEQHCCSTFNNHSRVFNNDNHIM